MKEHLIVITKGERVLLPLSPIVHQGVLLAWPGEAINLDRIEPKATPFRFRDSLPDRFNGPLNPQSGVGDILITGVLAVIALTLLALFLHLRGLREDLVHELRLRDITINSLELRAGGGK